MDAIGIVASAINSAAGGDVPVWLPDGASAVLDFKNGHYYADGSEQVVTDLLYSDEEHYNAFSFENIVNGVGLKGDWSNSSNPIFKPVIADGIIATGATIVLDFDLEDDAYIEVDLIDLPEFTNSEQIVFYSEEDQSYFRDAASAQTNLPDISSGDHKAAYTITPTKMAVSVDGGTVVTATPAMPSAAFTVVAVSMNINVDVLFSTLRSIIIYPAKADGELPALSSL